MSELDQKKLIIYGAVALIVIGVGAYLWYRTLGAPSAEPEEPATGVTGGVSGLPIPEAARTVPTGAEEAVAAESQQNLGLGERTLLQLTDYPVIAPMLSSAENKILFYKKDGGDLIALDLNGENEEKLSNITVVGVVEALWSGARDRAAVFYVDGEIKKGFIHIIAGGTTTTSVLPNNITSASWSPSGAAFAYTVRNGDALDLVTADARGGGRRVTFSTPLIDAVIRWVTADKIVFSTPPSAFAEGYAFQLTRSTGAFTKLAGPFFSFTWNPSPDGTIALASSAGRGGKNPASAIRDAAGAVVFQLPALVTIADKCSWFNEKKLYCAVPLSIPAGSAWPDNYLRGEVKTQDRLMLVDLGAKLAQDVYGTVNFDMSDLVITKDERYIFFVNRPDGTLWRVRPTAEETLPEGR